MRGRSPSLAAVLRLYAPLLAGGLGIALLLFMVDVGRLGPAFGDFDLRLVPVLLLMAVSDYSLRFLRWRLLARESTGVSPPLVEDVAIFLAANTLLLTPARAGDLTRSYWARRLFGTPVAQTAPVTVVERAADVAMMALLAMAGAVMYGQSALAFGAAVGVGAVAVFILSRRSARVLLSRGLARLVSNRPGIETFIASLHRFARPRCLCIAFGLGGAAWLIECVMFFIVLAGLGLEATPGLAASAAVIYPTANLAGSLSLLPGGIGVSDASITGLTLSMTAGTASQAVAAALLIRLAIVGFGVLTGLPGLLYVSRRPAIGHPGQEPAEQRPHGAVAA
jgi:uncharacterized membrane protein YbhN (UPF0104 family)